MLKTLRKAFIMWLHYPFPGILRLKKPQQNIKATGWLKNLTLVNKCSNSSLCMINHTPNLPLECHTTPRVQPCHSRRRNGAEQQQHTMCCLFWTLRQTRADDSI